MARNLDFGLDDSGRRPAGACHARLFRYVTSGVAKTVHVIGGKSICCGRHSEQDICLRVQPTSDEENARKTGMISREHFRLVNQDGTVTIQDLESTTGTTVNDASLDPSQVRPIASGDRIRAGGVLELQLATFASAQHSSGIGCCLISRIDNLPNETYLWLIDQAKFGSDADAVVQVSAKKSRSTRGLDFGGDSDSPGDVSLMWNDKGNLAVLCRSKQVKLNTVSLEIGETSEISSQDALALAGTVLQFD